MKRVFVLEQTANDLSRATEFGEVMHIFDQGKHRPGLFGEHFAQAIITQLERKSFDPAIDYVVIAGGMVPMVLMVTALVQEYGDVQLLLYHASIKDYVLYSTEQMQCIQRR